LGLGRSGSGDPAPGFHFLGVAELVEDQALLERAQRHDVLLAAGRVGSDTDEAGLEHRVADELVGALAALVGAEVVALLDVERVERAGGYEFFECDGLGGDGVEGL